MLLHTRGVRTVALLEAAKGALILAAGIGALSLKLAIFFVNLVIVAYMSYVLWQSRKGNAA
jgi:uncharacterized membrane protein (DUF2068 family)